MSTNEFIKTAFKAYFKILFFIVLISIFFFLVSI